MASDVALAVENLNKRFGGVVATDNVSLAVPRGGIQCIIGPNGAGKSTFFSLLAGIQKPDSGKITFNGVDITRLQPAPRVRQGLGLTFQTNRVFHDLSVRQNLEIAPRRGRARRRPDPPGPLSPGARSLRPYRR
jgi:ABC-type branched-subunit amino acid transport system ATPase component